MVARWGKCLLQFLPEMLVLGLLAVLVLSWSEESREPKRAQSELPMVELLVGGVHVLRAQVADDEQERRVGLMWRREMPEDEGMMFVFDEAGKHCFWMRDTYLSLSVAFLADDGRVVGLADMQSHDDTLHCAPEPVSMALEVHRGWFDRRGLGLGAKVGGLQAVRVTD